MFKRPRLALAALSLFLCLHLWGTPIEAVPAEGALAISEETRAASVITDMDNSRKILKPLSESVHAGTGLKILHPVPEGLLDVAQPASSRPAASPRRFRHGKGPRAHGKKRLLRKMREKSWRTLKNGKNRKDGKTNQIKKGRKSREVLRTPSQSRNSQHDLINAGAKAGNNSLESTSAMEKGRRYRKLGYGKKGTGSSRSKKLQITTMTNSNGTRVPENVSQPKDQEQEAFQVKAPESASASLGHALVSDTATPKHEPIATSQEPAMAQSVEPVTTQPGEPLKTQLSEPVTTQLELSEPVSVKPSEPAAKNSSEPATAQSSEAAARKPVEPAANFTAPVTSQPSVPAAASAHSGGPPGAPLSKTANATDSGPGGKGRKTSLHMLVPMLE